MAKFKQKDSFLCLGKLLNGLDRHDNRWKAGTKWNRSLIMLNWPQAILINKGFQLVAS